METEPRHRNHPISRDLDVRLPRQGYGWVDLVKQALKREQAALPVSSGLFSFTREDNGLVLSRYFMALFCCSVLLLISPSPPICLGITCLTSRDLSEVKGMP